MPNKQTSTVLYNALVGGASFKLGVMVCVCVFGTVQVQTRYLGRNWRRSNMKTISAIYRSVRHHLHDDWAYGNDLDARPWDFQQQVGQMRGEKDR